SLGCFYYFTNRTSSTLVDALSLHDALPISTDAGHLQCRRDQRTADRHRALRAGTCPGAGAARGDRRTAPVFRGALGRGSRRGAVDRKSTPLNSSHVKISYAVFCFKKKKRSC